MRIAAVLAALALAAGEEPGQQGPVVSRRPIEPPDKLRIRAQRMHGDRPVGEHLVRVIDGGPGPSYLNLPTHGCWRLTLRWSGRSDELDLDFLRRS